MANNKMTGIIFSNSHDDALGGLTARRSMGSVPFASRYRLIDLVLSRMSHAGVDSVALVMQNNYHSLMEHIGSGKEWDLSRKRGGIAYFPPYSSAGSAGYSRGTLESMTSLLGYLQSSSADYIAVSDCDVICGVDLSDVLEYHIAHKAGITLICTEHGHSSVMVSAGDDDIHISYIGLNSLHLGVADMSEEALKNLNECVLRIAVFSEDKSECAKIIPEISPLQLNGPPGASFFGGRARVQEVMALWPTTVPRDAVQVESHILEVK